MVRVGIIILIVPFEIYSDALEHLYPPIRKASPASVSSIIPTAKMISWRQQLGNSGDEWNALKQPTKNSSLDTILRELTKASVQMCFVMAGQWLAPRVSYADSPLIVDAIPSVFSPPACWRGITRSCYYLTALSRHVVGARTKRRRRRLQLRPDDWAALLHSLRWKEAYHGGHFLGAMLLQERRTAPLCDHVAPVPWGTTFDTCGS